MTVALMHWVYSVSKMITLELSSFRIWCNRVCGFSLVVCDISRVFSSSQVMLYIFDIFPGSPKPTRLSIANLEYRDLCSAYVGGSRGRGRN
jgi:hypothetical protein